MAKQAAVVKSEGEWTSGPAVFEQAIDEKRTIKSCLATSPDGAHFLSVREWRVKADGKPYYTRNSVLVPIADTAMRDAFIAALQSSVAPAPKASAKKAAPKKAAKA